MFECTLLCAKFENNAFVTHRKLRSMMPRSPCAALYMTVFRSALIYILIATTSSRSLVDASVGAAVYGPDVSFPIYSALVEDVSTNPLGDKQTLYDSLKRGCEIHARNSPPEEEEVEEEADDIDIDVDAVGGGGGVVRPYGGGAIQVQSGEPAANDCESRPDEFASLDRRRVIPGGWRI